MNQLPKASSLQPQAFFNIPCRTCGAPLHRSASGLLCIECRAKIIPSGDLGIHYEAYSDHHIELLPENHCNDADEIAAFFSRFRRLESGNLTAKQQAKLIDQQDRTFHRMTLRRLKIENENLRQRRMLFDGDEPQEIQIQRTLF